MTVALSFPLYPAYAKPLRLTGRVLVAYRITATGVAGEVKVVKAEGDPSLAQAALNLVRHGKFDLSDPAYNSADPDPYYLSVSYCLGPCGALVPFPGYESTVVTGSPLPSR